VAGFTVGFGSFGLNRTFAAAPIAQVDILISNYDNLPAPPAPIMSALGWLLCAAAASILLGCSQSNTSKKSQAAAASACERHILGTGDVAGILSAPITRIRSLPGDIQSCEFSTGGFPAIVVSVRPGVGRTTVDIWNTGKIPLASTPLAGVGDSAVWQETLHELVAQKNAVLCDIQVRGAGADLAIDASALPAAVGALCNKIFAAYAT
jgi:hypothetical protein